MMIAARRRARGSSEASPVAGRQLVWEETFRNLDNWTPEFSPHGLRLQFYTARSENVRVQDEKLIIEARREAYGGKAWTSAQVSSRGHHEFLYGLIEIRAKTPPVNGMWPAIWTLGQWFGLFQDGTGGSIGRGYSPGGICGEIDIMEAWGQQAGSSSIAHYAPYQTTASTGFTHDRTEWNVYQLHWTPDALGFAVNDSDPVMYPIASIEPFHIPHHLILNLAVDYSSSRSGVIDPATTSAIMEVDWVRVWTPEGDAVKVPLSIELEQTEVTVPAGQYVQIKQQITPARAHDQGTLWTSDNNTVAEADNGWIKANTPGTCTVTARTWNGVEATVAVTVT